MLCARAACGPAAVLPLATPDMSPLPCRLGLLATPRESGLVHTSRGLRADAHAEGMLPSCRPLAACAVLGTSALECGSASSHGPGLRQRSPQLVDIKALSRVLATLGKLSCMDT